MKFPLENQVVQILFWLANTAGVGGAVALFVGGGSLTAYFLTLRWIIRGGEADEVDEYVFPTSTLLGHGDHQ